MIIKGGKKLGSSRKGLNIFIPKKNIIAATNIMRDLLSASGKTAYDAAEINNWFSVSSADYAAVASGLSNASKYAMTDAQTTENGVAWSDGYAQAFPSTIGTIPSNTYLIGFISRTSNGGTSTPLISTTFRGTYTAIANSPNAATGGNRGYFLRKASAATASTSYIGIVNNGSNSLNGTTVFNLPAEQGGGYDNTIPYSTWISWNNASAAFNIFQMLGTSTKQW
jgi:hypothetical protein